MRMPITNQHLRQIICTNNKVACISTMVLKHITYAPEATHLSKQHWIFFILQFVLFLGINSAEATVYAVFHKNERLKNILIKIEIPSYSTMDSPEKFAWWPSWQR